MLAKSQPNFPICFPRKNNLFFLYAVTKDFLAWFLDKEDGEFSYPKTMKIWQQYQPELIQKDQNCVRV